MRAGSVFLEALPVALEGKDFAVENMQGGEEAPAAEKARLSRREARFFDGHEFRVVKNKAMEHQASGLPAQAGPLARASFRPLLYRNRQVLVLVQKPRAGRLSFAARWLKRQLIQQQERRQDSGGTEQRPKRKRGPIAAASRLKRGDAVRGDFDFVHTLE